MTSSVPRTSDPDPVLRSERPEDALRVEGLVDRAFGPGRFVKVSERVREFALFRPDLSICAWEPDRLAGVARQWQVTVAGRAVAFLGPLAVEDDARHKGLGGLLVTRACEAAEAAGLAAVLLVGDEPYFGRFGFAAAPSRGVVLPGPVDQRRVLACVFDPSAVLEGPVRPA